MQTWKIKREARRFGRQLRGIPEFFYEPFAQRAYEKHRAERLIVHDGAQQEAAKIAILLIFQPRGIVDSTILTCRHLREKGYAPLVISNAPLSDTDLSQLRPFVWKMVERPNFGYDFGGYRDGLWLLEQWKITPETLIVMNDSVWFPLDRNENLIDRMEASDADVIGAILRYKGLRGEIDEVATLRFVESYFYLFPTRTLRHPEFTSFWRDYKLTSNKYKVVRRGEMSFCREMIKRGFSLNGLLTCDDFLVQIARQPNEFIRTTIRYGVNLEAAREAQAQQVLDAYADTDEWRKAALAHIEIVVKKGVFHSHFPYASIRLMGTPFLKKTSDVIHQPVRERYLEAVAAGDLPAPDPAILSEIKSRVQE